MTPSRSQYRRSFCHGHLRATGQPRASVLSNSCEYSLELTKPAIGRNLRESMGAPQTLAKFGIGRRLIAGERQGEFTAQRLKKLAPHVYQAIIKLRGQDWGMLRIAQLLHVHRLTVAAVDTFEPEAIDIVRQRMTRKLLQCSHLLLERIEK